MILITGASGFIGQYFVEQFKKTNMRLRVLIRNPLHAKKFSPDIQVIIGDLTQPKSLVGLCEGIDSIFHLAGYVHADQQALQHHEINYLGTCHLLHEAVKSHVKRFIFMSTIKAVADSKGVIDENFDLLPHSPYGIAKRKAEQEILDIGKENNMHVAILRPALVYGPGVKGNLASMIRAINKGLFIPPPAIEQQRSMIGLADLYQAVRLAHIDPKANGKIYFVTDGKDYSTREIYNLIREALGKSPITWAYPLIIFKAIAMLGSLIEKITKRCMPFNLDAFDKLFGQAQYCPQLIQNELNFIPRDDFRKCLKAMLNK